MNFVLLCNSIYLLIVTTGTRPFPQPGNQLPPGDGFFLIFFFPYLFLSMFLVPWHFLPRTIFILDWLEQASCAYIYIRTVSYYFAMLYIDIGGLFIITGIPPH